MTRPCRHCRNRDLEVSKHAIWRASVRCPRCGYEIYVSGSGRAAIEKAVSAWNSGETPACPVFQAVYASCDNHYRIGGKLYGVVRRLTIPMIEDEDPLAYRFWRRKGILAEIHLYDLRGPLWVWEYNDGSYGEVTDRPLPRAGWLEKVRGWFLRG